MTQAERLAEAKITEEVNVASLNKIVKYEEDKRANQKMLAARRRAIGPFIRFVSSNRVPKEEKSPHEIQSIQKTNVGSPPRDVALVHPLDVLHCPSNSFESRRALVSAKLTTPEQQSLKNKKRQTLTYVSVENTAGDKTETGTLSARDLLFGRAPSPGNQPPIRPMCLLSGIPAAYKDPETLLPYGNLHAYRMIQHLKGGTVPWNPQLKMYVPRNST